MDYSKMVGLPKPMLTTLRGIGDAPNREILMAQRRKPVCIASHRGSVRDEHDRFLPMYFNNMNMPVNIKE